MSEGKYKTVATVLVEKRVVVEYYYTPPCRGHRDSLGVPTEPDDEEELIVEVVRDEAGNEIELADGEEDRIAEDIISDIHSGPDFDGD